MKSPIVYRGGGKRVVDLTVAAVAILALSPLLATVAVVSRIRQGSPVLFRQTRAGLDGRPFVLWKFRTMRDPAAGGSDDERLTEWGRFLRHSSIDELPQLLNVVVGDMSLVGPRPLYLHYLPHYSPEQALRLTVRPGLTGLAQVSGRNRLSWEERLGMDTVYAQGVSVRGDVVLLARTLALLLSRQPTSALDSETPAEFTGSTLHEPLLERSA